MGQFGLEGRGSAVQLGATRISRRPSCTQAIFTAAEAVVLPTPGPPSMTLHIGLKGTMNALFITDLAAKTHRGLRGRVAAGKSAGGLSYGYKPIRRIDERATRRRPCPRLMLTFRRWIWQVISGHAVHAVFLHLAWRDLV